MRIIDKMSQFGLFIIFFVKTVKTIFQTTVQISGLRTPCVLLKCS